MINDAKQLKNGTILIDEKNIQEKQDWIVVYARVSYSDCKNNLETQTQRLTDFCAAKGWTVNQVIKECASGLNDHRLKLIKILSERKATKIIVEQKDRLTRFGFNYIKIYFLNVK